MSNNLTTSNLQVAGSRVRTQSLGGSTTTVSPHTTVTPPDVILQTLPDVVMSFLESPPASNENCGLGSGVQTPEPSSPCSTTNSETGITTPGSTTDVASTAQNSATTSNFQFLTGTLVNNMVASGPKNTTLIKTENNELSNLGDLDSLHDLLGIAGVTGMFNKML